MMNIVESHLFTFSFSLSACGAGLSNPDPENTGILYTTDAISLALRAVKPEAEVIGNGLATYSFMNPAFPAGWEHSPCSPAPIFAPH